MFVIKPACEQDLEPLVTLAEIMSPGITTFPPDRDTISKKIAKSVTSFQLEPKQIDVPREFLLVLHDLSNNKVIGTAGIYSQLGHDVPFYSFKRIKQTQQTYLNDGTRPLQVNNTSLHLTHAFQGGTEVGTLLVHPDYSSQGLGKFLAKSRYMFIKIHQTLFCDPIVAELRGWTEEGDVSPFWNAVGRYFFGGMDYATADYLSATTNKQFIADLFPKYPIYEELLPEAARAIIHSTNSKGQAALKMLLAEGFRDEGYVDIFDAGATLVAKRQDLQTYRETNQYQISIKNNEFNPDSKEYYLATGDLNDFMLTKTANIHIAHDHVTISDELARRLNIQSNTNVWVYNPDKH